jgi:hypothetical protein
LDWKRFHSDLIVDFQKFQIVIVRRLSREYITHNYIGFADTVDYYDLSEDLIREPGSVPMGFSTSQPRKQRPLARPGPETQFQ